MRAVQVDTGVLEVRDIPVPDPGPGEVLVKVAGAGLCHSDCMISKSPSVYRAEGGGFTLGHETAGWIAATGPGVTGLADGQPVVVHAEWGCGSCQTCRMGRERFCPVVQPKGGAGLGFDGGMAEYLLVPAARNVIALPDSLDPRDAGPLDDAALTPYHAIRASMPWLEPGAIAVAIGIGGLGHMAIQLLRALSSATIVAVEKDPAKRAFALELGADVALDPADDAAARIKGMGLEGATLVLDLVGADDTLALAAACAARMGKIICVGAALGSYPFSLMSVPFECAVQTTFSGEAFELAQVVDLAAAGKLRVEATHITLEEVPHQLDVLDRGEHPPGRLIAVP